MSGFLALLTDDPRPQDPALLGRLTDAMAYRGPDAGDHRTMPHCGLGFTLLDTTDGRRTDVQPWSDGPLCIVADARLDGRGALLKALDRADAAQAPDAQLIVAAYERWGEACVDHLLGDFSFVLWDAARRRLVAARDGLGMRPFYYGKVAGGWVCGNTLHCLRQHPDIDLTLHEPALADYLLFGSNHDLTSTVFAGVSRLPPAHLLTWRPGDGVHVRRFMELRAAPADAVPRHFEDAAREYRRLLTQAVDDRMTSHHGAVFLSGGMDSPAVAALAQELLNRRSGDVRFEAFTAVYRRLLDDPEEAYARAVGEHLGWTHHVHPVDDYQLFEGWGERFWSAEPADGNMLPLNSALYRQVSTFSRVTFTGDGADPALIHPADDLWRQLARGRLDRVATYLWQALREGRPPPLGLRTAWLRRRQRRAWRETFPSWLRRDWVRRLGLEDRWRDIRFGAGGNGERDEALASLVDPSWVAVFESEDPGSSGFLLERRHPFFDLRLLRYSLALPAPWCRGKRLLRRAVADILPSKVLTRPKTPLAGVPQHGFAISPKRLLDDLPVAKEQLMEYLDRSTVYRDLDRIEETLHRVEATTSVLGTASSESADGSAPPAVSSSAAVLDDVSMRALNLAFWLEGLATIGKGSVS